jgi:hypothetical protein
MVVNLMARWWGRYLYLFERLLLVCEAEQPSQQEIDAAVAQARQTQQAEVRAAHPPAHPLTN